MSATINAFPPVHQFNSSRSWFMAVIVLLHVGFFWALSNGLSKQIFEKLPGSIWVSVPDTHKPPPPPVILDEPKDLQTWQVLAPTPALPLQPDDHQGIAAREMPREPEPIGTGADEGPGSAVVPIVVAPTIDPRFGFSEPIYPSASIRKEEQGTVLVSVRVGVNGRVIEARLERSSGYADLDKSALREARLWRFVPGTEDGRPTPMWTHVPIKFQLK